MKTMCQRLRWILLTAAVLGGVGLAAADGKAQSPSGINNFHRVAPKKYTREKTLRLPIQIDQQSRPLIQKVILFVRENGGPWQKKDEADPSQQYFVYHAPSDGEYWFSVVTVDKQGKSYPADVRQEPPNLIVFVEADNSAARKHDSLQLTGHTQHVQRPELPPDIPDAGLPRKPEQVAHLPQPQGKLPNLPKPDALPSAPETPIAPPPNPYPASDRYSDTMQEASQIKPMAGQHSDRQVINTTTAMIEYRIDKVGPSGVSKVDIWVKPEHTGVWQRMATDTNRQSPVEVKLPGEGLYGIRLAVTNGNGFGGNPPKANDQPSFWIEVDTTSPFAQLQPVESITTGGAIELKWKANDKNLDDRPVSLYYATRQGGPWFPIARGIENSGSHLWQFPRDVGSQFYVRLEVRDQAGNLSRVESQSPIMLDLTEPAATVVGVTPRTPAAGGHD